MNYKKIVLFFIIFMCLLGVGSMLSNVQSREADQLLEAHGLSNNTRYIEVNRNETISDFLRYLDKYKNANICIFGTSGARKIILYEVNNT